jgi:hypothetical protein
MQPAHSTVTGWDVFTARTPHELNAIRPGWAREGTS